LSSLNDGFLLGMFDKIDLSNSSTLSFLVPNYNANFFEAGKSSSLSSLVSGT